MKDSTIFHSKIAVFDLDGTLYKKNSHIEILCKYYKTHFFKSVFFKIIGKFSQTLQLFIMNRLYEQIPLTYRKNFVTEYSLGVVNLLNKKVREGFYPIIFSCAPKELIESAALKLGVEYCKCKSGYKHITLVNKYKFDYLFVCTDNKSDWKLLMMANESVITAVEKNRNYFKNKLKKGTYIFIDI